MPGLKANIILFVVLTAVLSACGTSRKFLGGEGDTEIESLWIKNSSLNIKGGTGKYRLELRAVRDSAMLIVLRSEFGMEGGRVLLDRNGVIILNRVKKKWSSFNYADLNQLSGGELSLALVEEAFFISRLDVKNLGDRTYEKEDYFCRNYVGGDIYSRVYCFDKQSGYNTKRRIELTGEQFSFWFSYGEFVGYDNINFPGSIGMERLEGSKFLKELSGNIELQIKKVEINQELSVGIKIPVSYKRVESLKELWK